MKRLREIEERLRQILIDPLQKGGEGRQEPLDIWTELQKHLRDQITLTIAGLPVFPSRHATIEVPVQNEAEQHRLEAALSPELLRSAIAEFLETEGCRPPAGFWVSVAFVPRAVQTRALEVRFDNEASEASPGDGAATLRVIAGEAATPELKIAGSRINLGRRARLTDEQGQGVRHNDVAFSDTRNGVNETVSRRHAHLEFDESIGGYRLFRDSASAETAVKRQGSTLDVPLSGRGIALKPGDVIRLGKAEIEFLK
jgi:hypothetical protein